MALSNIPKLTLVDGTLNVVPKIKLLTEEILSTDSIYMRAKDTFKELLDERHLSESEYAQIASQFISQLAVTTIQQVITSAMQWAIQEKEAPYKLAAEKAQAELVLANIEKVKHEISKAEKEIELEKANITATLATSIRKNGRVSEYRDDGYTPVSLYDEGSEYTQMRAVEAQRYNILAETYRKDGIVTTGIDIDGVHKGVSGNNAGYTKAQEDFAKRQILSFEDSKRNHAANAASQMIGQLLNGDIAPSSDYVEQWKSAMNYLIKDTPIH